MNDQNEYLSAQLSKFLSFDQMDEEKVKTKNENNCEVQKAKHMKVKKYKRKIKKYKTLSNTQNAKINELVSNLNHANEQFN